MKASYIPLALLLAILTILASTPSASVSAVPVLDLDLAASPLLHERAGNIQNAKRREINHKSNVGVVRKRYELGYMEEARPLAKAHKVKNVKPE